MRARTGFNILVIFQLMWFLVNLTVFAGLVWAVIHFVAKYW